MDMNNIDLWNVSVGFYEVFKDIIKYLKIWWNFNKIC